MPSDPKSDQWLDPEFDRALVSSARAVLDAARQEVPGRPVYRVPNLNVYPHQWLWDSCFHAVALTTLGDLDAALAELEALFWAQTPEGFVPHMTHHRDPGAAQELWKRDGRSIITQPPMYGHALRVLAAGIETSGRHDLEERLTAVCQRATAALHWLFRHRSDDEDGRLVIVHPWESGCDNSPRFDGYLPEPWSRPAWDRRKRELLATLCDYPAGGEGAPVSNPRFRVRSAMFNALAAFNALELAQVTGDFELYLHGVGKSGGLDAMWDDEVATWCDIPDLHEDSPVEAVQRCARARTANGLLGVLVTKYPERAERVFDQLTDPAAFGAPFGPTEVHRADPAFNPAGYWRGGTWPQVSYLLWLAAHRWGHPCAPELAAQLRAATAANGFAEYWDPDTAAGHGAIPCTWATVSIAAGYDFGATQRATFGASRPGAATDQDS